MRFLILVMALVSFAPIATADDALTGNWKLVSFYTVDAQTKQRTKTYGEHPTGAIGFTPAGRFFAFVTADNRPPSRTDQDRLAAFKSMIAYTGKYRVEGGTCCTLQRRPSPTLMPQAVNLSVL